MNTNKSEAEAMLAQAQQASLAVKARSAKEYLPFFLWGGFLALIIPGFDFVDRDVWGWVTIAVTAVAFVGTVAYFATKASRVRVSERSPWWTWPAWTVWMSVWALIAAVLDGVLPFSYVLAGWMSALPLLIWGWRLRSAA